VDSAPVSCILYHCPLYIPCWTLCTLDYCGFIYCLGLWLPGPWPIVDPVIVVGLPWPAFVWITLLTLYSSWIVFGPVDLLCGLGLFVQPILLHFGLHCVHTVVPYCYIYWPLQLCHYTRTVVFGWIDLVLLYPYLGFIAICAPCCAVVIIVPVITLLIYITVSCVICGLPFTLYYL